MAMADGKRLCGYKMGLTSRAKQRDVNVFDPIRGYLLADMEVEKGGLLNTSTRIIHGWNRKSPSCFGSHFGDRTSPFVKFRPRWLWSCRR